MGSIPSLHQFKHVRQRWRVGTGCNPVDFGSSRFDSYHMYFIRVAQLVEQESPKLRVAGSIPASFANGGSSDVTDIAPVLKTGDSESYGVRVLLSPPFYRQVAQLVRAVPL